MNNSSNGMSKLKQCHVISFEKFKNIYLQILFQTNVAFVCTLFLFFITFMSHDSAKYMPFICIRHSKTVNRCSIKAQTLMYVLNGFYFALFCFAHFLKFETLKRLNDSICAFCMKGKYMIRKHYSSNKFQELRIFSTCQQRFFTEKIYYIKSTKPYETYHSGHFPCLPANKS